MKLLPLEHQSNKDDPKVWKVDESTIRYTHQKIERVTYQVPFLDKDGSKEDNLLDSRQYVNDIRTIFKGTL